MRGREEDTEREVDVEGDGWVIKSREVRVVDGGGGGGKNEG